MKVFKSFEEFEAWADYNDESVPVLIDDGWNRSMDMTTECKSWKVALRRFAKEFKTVPEVTEWIPGIREGAEGGFFSDSLTYYDKDYEYEINRKHGSYSYGIEKIDDGRWYIFLNLSGVYAGFPERV